MPQLPRVSSVGIKLQSNTNARLNQATTYMPSSYMPSSYIPSFNSFSFLTGSSSGVPSCHRTVVLIRTLLGLSNL